MKAFLSLRALGDLIIHYRCVYACNTYHASNLALVTLQAHSSLISSLGLNSQHIAYIPESSTIPAIYNLTNTNPLSLIKDLWHIRRFLAGSQFDTFYLPSNTSRDALFSYPFNVLTKPPLSTPCSPQQNNIYFHILQLLETPFSSLLTPCLNPGNASSSPSRVSIFIGSRNPLKTLSLNHFYQLQDVLTLLGIKFKLFNVLGDFHSLTDPQTYITIPRDFVSLIATIKQSDYVISTDSLVGHLAELLGKPTFILFSDHASLPYYKKTPQTYWLPPTAYLNNYYHQPNLPHLQIRLSNFFSL